MTISELRATIQDEVRAIMEPARAAAEVRKKEILRQRFGSDFDYGDGWLSVGGFRVGGVTCDQYGNLFIRELPEQPPRPEQILPLVEAVVWRWDREIQYPLRCVSSLLIAFTYQYPSLVRETVAEMLRVGDLYCERGSGFRRWAFGSAPGVGHLGGTENCPAKWLEWFPEAESLRRQREDHRANLRRK